MKTLVTTEEAFEALGLHESPEESSAGAEPWSLPTFRGC